MAGSSAASAPMSSAAAKPPAQASAGITVGQFLPWAYRAVAAAPAMTPAAPPSRGQCDRLGQKLGSDVAPGGAERAAQPDLGPPLARAGLVVRRVFLTRVIDLVRADCAGGRMASPPAGYALSSVDGQRQSAAASYGLFGLVHAERGSGKLESFH